MYFKNTLVILLLITLTSCVTKEQATSYMVLDLKQRVEDEYNRKKLPKAWGTVWVEHWKDQYKRVRKYGPKIPVYSEYIIREIEKERRLHGLPPINIEKILVTPIDQLKIKGVQNSP